MRKIVPMKEGRVRFAARLIRAGQRISVKKGSFLGVFALVFVGSVFTLAAFNLLPSPADGQVRLVHLDKSDLSTAELPLKIEIPEIGVLATIVNPANTGIEELDQELLKGAVRYPTSARLGEDGNVVLFGHSSYLPIVGNPAYKTFNGIQKLTPGNTIQVYSSLSVYTYRVRSMTKESADTAAIPLSITGKVLTLSTCNSFAEKSDRFVVVADFVESHPILQ